MGKNKFENPRGERKKNVNYLKERNFQFYVVLDIEAPTKVIIRDLPKIIKVENIQNELTKNDFDIIKGSADVSRIYFYQETKAPKKS